MSFPNQYYNRNVTITIEGTEEEHRKSCFLILYLEEKGRQEQQRKNPQMKAEELGMTCGPTCQWSKHSTK